MSKTDSAKLLSLSARPLHLRLHPTPQIGRYKTPCTDLGSREFLDLRGGASFIGVRMWVRLLKSYLSSADSVVNNPWGATNAKSNHALRRRFSEDLRF